MACCTAAFWLYTIIYSRLYGGPSRRIHTMLYTSLLLLLPGGMLYNMLYSRHLPLNVPLGLGRQPLGCPCSNPCCVRTILFWWSFRSTWWKGLRLGGLLLAEGACCWWWEASWESLGCSTGREALLCDLPTPDDANQAAVMTMMMAVEVSYML